MKPEQGQTPDARPRKMFVVILCGLIITVALVTSRFTQNPEPSAGSDSEPDPSELVTGDEDGAAAVSPPQASAASTRSPASASQDSKTKRSPRAKRQPSTSDIYVEDLGEFDPAAAEAEASVVPPAPDPAAAAEAEALAVKEAQRAAEAALMLGQAPASGDRESVPSKLGTAAEKAEVARDAASPYQDVRLAFKLDPRLTQGLFMGERWVSPPTYIKSGEGQTCTLEASLRGVDTQGRPTDINATWIPADPGLLTVTPGPGRTVQLTVHGAGRTSLEVASVGFSKRLPVNAMSFGDTLVVEVYQQ